MNSGWLATGKRRNAHTHNSNRCFDGDVCDQIKSTAQHKYKHKHSHILGKTAAPFERHKKPHVASDVNNLCVNINVRMETSLRNSFVNFIYVCAFVCVSGRVCVCVRQFITLHFPWYARPMSAPLSSLFSIDLIFYSVYYRVRAYELLCTQTKCN